MYDSGATSSFISSRKLKQVSKEWLVPCSNVIKLGNDSSFKSLGRAKLSLTIGNAVKSVDMIVVNQLAHDVMIGLDVIKEFGLEQRKDLNVYLDGICITENRADRNLTKQVSINMMSGSPCDGVKKILDEFNQLFSGLGKNGRICHKINLVQDKIIRHKQQDIPIHWKEHVKSHINELIELDVIEESTSNYRSRIVPIKKKDGSLRMAIDYRDLNAITKADAFPMPIIKNIIIRLAGAKIFSKIDLKSGYYQILMDSSSKKFTAFAFENKLYQFKRMPFGLVSAPQTFQRLMESLLGHLDYVECYLDDILIFSKSEEEHIRHLRNVFNILKNENLRLNPDKCEFGVRNVNYLGLKIGNGSRSIITENKTKILNFPKPTNQREVTTFVCMAGFYRDLIKNFAYIAKPLFDCANSKKFEWTPREEEAFHLIRMNIEKNSEVKIPDPSLKFIVTCDASDVGYGATLSQFIDGEKTAVDFFSKMFSSAQKKYSTYDKEATAILEALKHWRHYLLGRPFRIETDHKPLKWLLSKSDCSGRLGRMVMKLMEYEIEGIDHIKGNDNVLADTLSRIQLNLLSDTVEETMDDTIKKDPGNFQKIDGRWFRVEDQKKRLYIRDQVEQMEILKSIHEYGHFGLFRNQEELRKRFWWPKWKDDLKQFLKKCVRCAAYKDDIERTRLPMICGESEMDNWHRIGLDICGPFEKSLDGNRYMVLVQDYASRFLVGTSMSDVKAEGISRWLSEIFSIFGWPSFIRCDRGSQFESARFRKFAKENNIELEFATIGHHQTNGLIERANRTMEQMIRTSISNQKEWDRCLPNMIAAYNGSTHSSTRLAPYKVMFGHEMQTQLDVKYNIIHEQENLEDLKQQRIRNSQVAQQSQKLQYDKVCKFEFIKAGDLVWWHSLEQKLGSSKKLNRRWRGPFIVDRIDGPNCIILDSRNNKRSIHRNHIKKCESGINLPLDVIRDRGRPALRAEPGGRCDGASSASRLSGDI